MAKKRVFVSYDHSEDLRYKNLLKAWDANDNFDFEFDQRSPNEPIDSKDAAVIKQHLTKMMQQSNYFLAIVGEKSYTSKWMKWEIEKAKELKLSLAVVKISSTNTMPSGLLEAGAAIARSFTLEGVVKALDEAS